MLAHATLDSPEPTSPSPLDADPPGWSAWLTTPEAAKATGAELHALRAQALAVVDAGLAITSAFYPAGLAALRSTILDTSLGECGACGAEVGAEVDRSVFRELLEEASDPDRLAFPSFPIAFALGGLDVEAGRLLMAAPPPVRIRALVKLALADAVGGSALAIDLSTSPSARVLAGAAAALLTYADRCEHSEGPTKLHEGLAEMAVELLDEVEVAGGFADSVAALRAAGAVVSHGEGAKGRRWTEYAMRDAARAGAHAVFREGGDVEECRSEALEFVERVRAALAVLAPEMSR